MRISYGYTMRTLSPQDAHKIHVTRRLTPAEQNMSLCYQSITWGSAKPLLSADWEHRCGQRSPVAYYMSPKWFNIMTSALKFDTTKNACASFWHLMLDICYWSGYEHKWFFSPIPCSVPILYVLLYWGYCVPVTDPSDKNHYIECLKKWSADASYYGLIKWWWHNV